MTTIFPEEGPACQIEMGLWRGGGYMGGKGGAKGGEKISFEFLILNFELKAGKDNFEL